MLKILDLETRKIILLSLTEYMYSADLPLCFFICKNRFSHNVSLTYLQKFHFASYTPIYGKKFHITALDSLFTQELVCAF